MRERLCNYCDKVFLPSSANGRYCCAKCRYKSKKGQSNYWAKDRYKKQLVSREERSLMRLTGMITEPHIHLSLEVKRGIEEQIQLIRLKIEEIKKKSI